MAPRLQGPTKRPTELCPAGRPLSGRPRPVRQAEPCQFQVGGGVDEPSVTGAGEASSSLGERTASGSAGARTEPVAKGCAQAL